MTKPSREYTSVEICAGAGGQAVGLHKAGFRHRALIEVDQYAVQTLRTNLRRGDWEGCQVLDWDLNDFSMGALKDVLRDEPLGLLSGGVPCPPFSLAGRRLGRDDERDLFPVMLDMVEQLFPRAVLIENVRGLLEPKDVFADYRRWIVRRLERLDYQVLSWSLVEASDFGVPQRRSRAVMIAMRTGDAEYFRPVRGTGRRVTVAEALNESMRSRFGESKKGLAAYERWRAKALEANAVAPTLVGGSKKHGGPDLGPSRAKRAWERFGVDGHGVANPVDQVRDSERDLYGQLGPKLTVAQAAVLQGFPPEWEFEGGKTAAYRQVGNAFPPPVAQALGEAIIAALRAADTAARNRKSRRSRARLLPAGTG
ncbi:DNA (cytosine-5)-methyltransferase 1 [Nocardiopsis arvandica]|uniref:DNA (cytosine-5-)-methyltransferase n=1 Tax=Nocardiopsis sinuspersici TaxID=501010 RepID=A0A7Y9XD86_9ACTN|nr:DNA cytosine methyltransferase [Nocardiopsis sinuspersici]NYH52205.1 DNA (cytosine-5)-methyltransferase 1 [Nocardiopsis sinuspersici]